MNTKFVILVFCIIALAIQAKKLRNQDQSLKTNEAKRFWANADIYCHQVCAHTHSGYVCPAKNGEDFTYQCAKTQNDCMTWYKNFYTCNGPNCMPWLYSLANYIIVDC